MKVFEFSRDGEKLVWIAAKTKEEAIKHEQEEGNLGPEGLVVKELSEEELRQDIVDVEDWEDPESEGYNPEGRSKGGYMILGSMKDIAKGCTWTEYIATTDY